MTKEDILNLVKKELDKELGKDCYRLITVALSGSKAYGIDTDDSDTDVMGIFLPNSDSYFYGSSEIEKVKLEKIDNIEGIIYDFRFWFSLVLNQNPNILELLWHSDQSYLYRDNYLWNVIVSNRDKFLSKNMINNVIGYAINQQRDLHKIGKNKIAEENFNKFGFDVKKASTIIRILNTTIDTVESGKMPVHRSDADFLKSIRNGAYKYSDIIRMAMTRCNLLREMRQSSKLNDTIDDVYAEEFLIRIVKMHLGLL